MTTLKLKNILMIAVVVAGIAITYDAVMHIQAITVSAATFTEVAEVPTVMDHIKTVFSFLKAELLDLFAFGETVIALIF